MTVERIYIGGLDPPRLSGKDVAARLKSLDIEVHSIEDKGKCFIHLTATSTSGEESALSKISQQYNNVKWKGCRLSVAEAKPHFLQRLAIEQQERKEKEASEVDLNQHKSTEQVEGQHDEEEDENEDNAPNRIPRRLRIRKKFGDEAFHVDTRPFSVENWKNFCTAKRKLKKRAENHAEKALKIKAMKDTAYAHAPLMHRAVHIRFGSTSVHHNGAPTRAVSSSDEDEASESEHEKSDSSVSSDESSEEEASRREEKTIKTSSYDWSDDESESDNDEGAADNSNMVASESSASDSINNVEQNTPQTSKQDYQWSSDSSSDESSVQVARTRNFFQEVAADDEFAAGLDDDKWNDSDDEDNIPACETNAKDTAYQMDNDVSANLGVLANLFPDMKDTSPENPQAKDEKSTKDASKSSTKRVMPFGIMPRYDPTAVTSQKYEVKEEEGEDEEDGDEEMEEVNDSEKNDESEEASKEESVEDDIDDGEGDEDDKKTEAKEEDIGNIYHQDKLEDVFREARDAWQVKSSQSIPKKKQKKEQTSSTGAFSFGFDLGNAEPEEESKGDEGFSFGFNLPPEKTSESTSKCKQSINADDANNEEAVDLEDNVEAISERNIKRRRGLQFSESEVESYNTDFFSHNHGNQIVDDLQGFRDDPNEREQWLRERQALTLDWKRKRKHAMSRIHKRIRNN